MTRLIRVLLVDRLGYKVAEIDKPDDDSLTVVYGGQVYMRINRKALTYRWVSTWISDVTPDGGYQLRVEHGPRGDPPVS